MMVQVDIIAKVVAAEKYKCKVNIQNVIIAKSPAVIKLVKTAGLSFPFNVGTRAIMKPICAAEIT